MRLPDIVNQVRRKVSEGTNFVRHPVQVLSQKGRKRLQTWYENAKLPGQDKQNDQGKQGTDSEHQQTVVSRSQPTATQSQSGSSYRSVNQAATAVATRNTTEPSLASTTVAVASPETRNLHPLQDGEQLQGTWGGRYIVGNLLQSHDWRYLYEGIQEYSNELVWIYVYTLSKDDFNQQEIAVRGKAFERLISANLKLGHDRDFRILKIKDAFSDHKYEERCYLVTKPLPDARTLSQYLEHHALDMTPWQVRQVLQQVLQSLKYLHSAYRVYWMDESSEQGLYHGNLNLDSLWVRVANRYTASGTPQFFVYLSNFALWEHLFSSEKHEIATHAHDLGSAKKDLQDLGWIAFSLLTKHRLDPQNPPSIGALNPQEPQHWPPQPQAQALKPYILRLMGLGAEEPFKSVETAETALDRLPLMPPVAPPPAVLPDSGPESESRSISSNPIAVPLWLLWLVGLGVIGLSTWWLFKRAETEPSIFPVSCSENCKLEDIEFPALETTIQYGVETSSSWNQAVNRTLTSSPTPDRESAFEYALEQRNSGLSLKREFPPLNSFNRLDDVQKDFIIQQLRLQKNNWDFALVQLTDDWVETLPEDLDFEVVGFDAIAAFVAFSDANRERSIPTQLNGQISLNQLQEVFTEWDGTISDSGQYKPYIPNNRQLEPVIEEFEQFLFDAEDERAKFERVQQDLLNAELSQRSFSQNASRDVYARLLADFESPDASEKAIGIGFDRFSNMWGQCSVYPLAIQQGMSSSSLLVESDGQVVSPNTDLCGDKGSYWANPDAFPTFQQDGKTRLNRSQAYPLAVELAVVYPKCENAEADSEAPCNAGQAFAQMLQTVEGQYLLSEMGLVPIMPIEKMRRIVWSQAANENESQ